jgi:hypothetical protein
VLQLQILVSGLKPDLRRSEHEGPVWADHVERHSRIAQSPPIGPCELSAKSLHGQLFFWVAFSKMILIWALLEILNKGEKIVLFFKE